MNQLITVNSMSLSFKNPAAALAMVMIIGAMAAWLDAAAAVTIKGNQVIVAYGSEQGPHAVITFNKDRAARQGLMIETFGAGAAGSKLSVTVDQKPLFVHSFTSQECSGSAEKGHCTVMINNRDQMSGRVRDSFRRGRISRLQLETGGVMSMQLDAELQGFGRAAGGKPR